MMDWFLVLAVALLAFHAIGLAHLLAAESRAKTAARARGLPDWMAGQATRNRARVSRLIIASMATAAAAGWLGVSGGGWRLGAAGFAVGFNLVSCAAEAAGIVAQRRLLAEIKAQARQTRPKAASVQAEPSQPRSSLA